PECLQGPGLHRGEHLGGLHGQGRQGPLRPGRHRGAGVRPSAGARSAFLEHPAMNRFATVFYDCARLVAGHCTWAGPLAVRIVVGWVFLWSGWTKLHILPRMIENFREWGIPAPEFFTPLTAGIEFGGGILLLIGLLPRFAAVPMMIVMVVAVASAKWADVDSLETLLGFE